MNTPLSIIMGVYNGATHLRECVDSVLAQSYADFEFVIIDDASTDSSLSILTQYAAQDPRIKIIRNQTNIGLTKSLNKGICTAVGTYIARMDADDIALPERFAKQVAFLDTHSDYGLVGTWARVVDDTGAEIDTYAWESTDADIRKSLIKYNNIIHPSVMMRRTVLDRTGYYDESFRYAQDYDLFLRMIAHTKAFNIPEHLLRYRVSSMSITGSKNRAQAWCALRARWNAIKSGTYSILSVVYLLRPLVGMILPLWSKRILKKSAL
jgi:glycosyltransferase involved in cell wall biosynthesis